MFTPFNTGEEREIFQRPKFPLATKSQLAYRAVNEETGVR